MEGKTRPPTWKSLLAFAIIYFVWGSTYLSIRVGVREVPPFLLAAMRFLVAGIVLYGWMMRGASALQAAANGHPHPYSRFSFLSSTMGIVLGGTARTFGNRRGHDGHDPCVYGAVGNIFSANSETHRALGPGSLDRNAGVAVLMSSSLNLAGLRSTQRAPLR